MHSDIFFIGIACYIILEQQFGCLSILWRFLQDGPGISMTFVFLSCFVNQYPLHYIWNTGHYQAFRAFLSCPAAVRMWTIALHFDRRELSASLSLSLCFPLTLGALRMMLSQSVFKLLGHSMRIAEIHVNISISAEQNRWITCYFLLDYWHRECKSICIDDVMEESSRNVLWGLATRLKFVRL